MSDEINTVENNEEYEPLIVSVLDEDGVEHLFEELGTIDKEDTEYVALLPVYDEAEDLIDDDGELIILKRVFDGDEMYLEPIEDEDEFMQIGQMFEEKLADLFDFDD